MKSNTSVIYTVALLGIVFLGYILWNIDYADEIDSNKTEKKDFFYCGTPGPRTEIEYEGSIIFQSNCASCHRVNRRMMGPAINEVISSYPSDTLLYNYISTKKPLKGTYCLRFENITQEETTLLYAYIKSFE